VEYIKLDNKQIPIVEEYDVVVIGGGTSGAVAAISSGRENLKTLVIEHFGSLGGSQTMGLVTPMMHNHLEGNPYSSAIDEEICDRMIECGYGMEARGNKGLFDPQMLKVILEEMVIESGSDILYHTSVIDVIRDDNKIKALLIHNKDGITAIKAKCFIDCSGDADVVKYAGLPFESGDKDGINQAVSLRFNMSNINIDKFGDYLESIGQKGRNEYPNFHTAVTRDGNWPMNTLFEQKCEEGILNEDDLKYFQVFSVPGKPYDLSFNCPELGGQKNVADAKYLTNKQIQGKKAIIRLTKFLNEFVPGFEEAYISDIASMVGIRESRRVIAEYQFKTQDVLGYIKFEDGILQSNYPLDVHGGDDNFQYVEKDPSQAYFELPYRSLVVKDIDNLLVAGRCIGADFLAQSTIRVQQPCRAMGEATGIAAKIAIQNNIPFREVDGKLVRDRMKQRGAKL